MDQNRRGDRHGAFKTGSFRQVASKLPRAVEGTRNAFSAGDWGWKPPQTAPQQADPAGRRMPSSAARAQRHGPGNRAASPNRGAHQGTDREALREQSHRQCPWWTTASLHHRFARWAGKAPPAGPRGEPGGDQHARAVPSPGWRGPASHCRRRIPSRLQPEPNAPAARQPSDPRATASNNSKLKLRPINRAHRCCWGRGARTKAGHAPENRAAGSSAARTAIRDQHGDPQQRQQAAPPSCFQPIRRSPAGPWLRGWQHG